jgi:hypothetical protein
VLCPTPYRWHRLCFSAHVRQWPWSLLCVHTEERVGVQDRPVGLLRVHLMTSKMQVAPVRLGVPKPLSAEVNRHPMTQLSFVPCLAIAELLDVDLSTAAATSEG